MGHKLKSCQAIENTGQAMVIQLLLCWTKGELISYKNTQFIFHFSYLFRIGQKD
jgi:hypothetical protein